MHEKYKGIIIKAESLHPVQIDVLANLPIPYTRNIIATAKDWKNFVLYEFKTKKLINCSFTKNEYKLIEDTNEFVKLVTTHIEE